MAAMHARVFELEGKVQEHSQSFLLLREGLTHLDERVDRLEQRFDRLDDRMSRQFLWLVGIQVTVLAAVVGGFVAVIGQLIAR